MSNILNFYTFHLCECHKCMLTPSYGNIKGMALIRNIQCAIFPIHPKLRNINLHSITHSLISRNPKERMIVLQISLLIVTYLSLISWFLSLMQTTKEVNPHPHIVPYVNMWSVFFFFFLCDFLNVGACICDIAREGQVEWTTPIEVRGEWIQIW